MLSSFVGKKLEYHRKILLLVILKKTFFPIWFTGLGVCNQSIKQR